MFRLTLATRLALSMSLFAGCTATAGAADNAQLTQRETDTSFRRKLSCNSG